MQRGSFWRRWFGVALLIGIGPAPVRGSEPHAQPDVQSTAAAELLDPDRLMAWCIVPFDGRHRGPADRAAMLHRLGFRHFAYDYRAEHIPTFDAEIEALQRQGISLDAWWFPTTLDAEAQQILEVIRRHQIKPQLWVTGQGGPVASSDEQRARVNAEAERLRPIAIAAAELGCQVGLYNHGGWFGEPENQLAILRQLHMDNVGLVYNLHHGHEHLDRFASLLEKIRPHLLALNLNGMSREGEPHQRKILPLGQGEFDLALLKVIHESGYRGPLGILGHTLDDAEDRLRDNLDGLTWLAAQLDGQSPDHRPVPRTPVPGGPKISPAQTIAPAPADFPVHAAHTAAHRPAESETSADPVAPIPAEFDQVIADELLKASQQEGQAQAGAAVFRSAKFACISCHRVGKFGGAVGPALDDVGKRLAPGEIVTAVLWPRHQVKPEFMAWRVVTSDGQSLQGYRRKESAAELELFDPATQKTHTIDLAEIEDQREVGTLMPAGLVLSMSNPQRRDLIRFLLELGHTPGLEAEVRPDNATAEFAFERWPLDPHRRPLWQAEVNRSRLYDFYTKEALFFRDQMPRPHLLPQFPGLDGGTAGHWGNQNEETWKDNRWSTTDLGSLLCGVFLGPERTVAKGVCVRLGDQGELAACFDPETLTYAALWRGGFLKLSDIRHGLLDGLRPAGEMLPLPAQEAPTKPFVYHGFYRIGNRVVFAYRLGDEELLDSAWVSDGRFERIVAPVAQHPLRAALAGGPAQWPVSLHTTGKRGEGRPYAIDTIGVPTENPWRALLFCSDHDFLSDGSALVATIHGDVWRVTGLDDDLQQVSWRRFAAGLHQPLGLMVVDDQIFVLGRDQITHLQDLNGDGEADYYECFSNRMVTSPAAHDFICGLARDREGRFYSASSKQGLIRFSRDGAQLDVLATGFRNPDGLGIYPDGAVTVPCSEGDWTPASMLCLVQPDHSAGAAPYFGYGGPLDGQAPALPFVYLPRGLDNSSGGQINVPDERWGPLVGQMLHFSYGAGTHFLLLRDEVAGQPQGGVVPLDGEFRAGAQRGRFHPRDGQLYVTGMSGWGTYTPDDGCFERVRYTGQPVQLPRSFHVHENGVLVSFTGPVDPQRVAVGKHFAQVWNYRYGPGYGSAELAPSHPNVVGHEALEIAGVHWINSTTVFVEIPALQPVNQLQLLLDVDEDRPQEMILTVHRLDQPYTWFAGYRPTEKIIAAHPLSVDLALLGQSQQNPWQNRRPYTATLELQAGQNLTYSVRSLRCKAGENVRLIFRNPDVVPHNWVLIKPGTLAHVGDLANKAIADPQAVLRQYVPESDDVIAYTDIVSPEQEFKIYFQAPAEKGRYHYLCTFPGHWMVMNGELTVE